MKLKVCIILSLMFISEVYLIAQDYLITFAGSGGSMTVSTVMVENITQAKSLEMDGSKGLHLMGVVTGIETVSNDQIGKVVLYPNPMKDLARMQFILPEAAETFISLYDLSGRKIVQTRDLLLKGEHTYVVQGIEEGLYIVRINSEKYSSSGILIASGSPNRNAKIVYGNSTISKEKQIDSKGTNEEVIMQYTTGDILKFTGISGNYSTIITDVPAASKTITFNFVECTDGDGNDYPVVGTGTDGGKCPKQIWMAANLKTTKYNDGTTVIPLINDNTEWSKLNSDAYCWYDNNETANKTTYGALYNWYTVKTGKLCPSGWHIPNDTEWTYITDYVGGLSVAGGKLKEAGTLHWKSPNTGATNISGFTSRPGSYRKEDGSFYPLGEIGVWWSATQNETTNAWSRSMFYNNDDVKRTYYSLTNGLSVRCVKDN